MSVAIDTTSTTLPGQFLEVSRAMQSAELAINAATRPNNVQITTDYENLTTTVTVTLPIAISGAGNALTISASDYFVGL